MSDEGWNGEIELIFFRTLHLHPQPRQLCLVRRAGHLLRHLEPLSLRVKQATGPASAPLAELALAAVAIAACSAFAATAAWLQTAAIATARKLGRPSVDRPGRNSKELLTSSAIDLHRPPRQFPGPRQAAAGASGNRHPCIS